LKTFAKAIATLVGSLVVFSIVIVFGLVYSFFYSLWKTITLKDWKAFFLFWWHLIDGFFEALGVMIGNIAISYDVFGNVLGGEMLEDLITFEEETTFGEPITASASIGEVEIKGKLIPQGEKLSKVLNVVFNQRSHAVDSWLIHLERLKLTNQFFLPRKKH
jgi:hypothetical protein